MTPVQAEADWDHDWSSQVPGVCVAPSGIAFTATLHDRRAPFTVRWRCVHAHADAGLAELCALDARRALERGDLLAVHHGDRLERVRPGLDVTHPGGMRGSGPAAAGRPRRPAVRLTVDPGVTVTVAVPPGGTVSTRVAAGGNFEVTVCGPDGSERMEGGNG